MKQLRELEKRVLDVIQKNNELKSENARLKDECKLFEATIMKKSTAEKSLITEKSSIATTIEELLNTISSLETSK